MTISQQRHFDELKQTLLTVVPDYEPDLKRFGAILTAGDVPTITVVGKYNHGKSRLLNELIGSDVFSVADKRETTTLNEYIYHQVRWLDAPGLDADVNYADDAFSHIAIWQQADIRLFIHALREGEFDADELTLLNQLTEDERTTQRQTVVIFTQIDQVADSQTVGQITQQLQQQVTLERPFFLSAQRHRQGIEQNKRLLVERSGITQLQQELTDRLTRVPAVRRFEKAQICQKLFRRLNQLEKDAQQHIEDLTQFLAQQRQDFERDLTQVLDKVQEDLRPIMVVEGEDASLEQDSFAMKYQLTAGKKDRNRIQVAYSRACININSHLVRYGVVGLPDKQKTHVSSLDTVMVAVLGVSVKLRRELNLIFFQPAGRQRLMREFCRYFEISQERMANKDLLKQYHDKLQQIQLGINASAQLEQL